MSSGHGPGGLRRSIDSVAASAGFNSAAVFRRAFERRFGVAPSAYRNGFGLARTGPDASA
jgi:transcriptional regulator GlxA family with amidase domain